jgi:hypothetical protein
VFVVFSVQGTFAQSKKEKKRIKTLLQQLILKADAKKEPKPYKKK